MNPHPSLLIFVPIFLLEILLMVYFPVWGVVAPFTLAALVLLFQTLTPGRIVRVCLVLGIIGELLVAVDRGSYLLAFAAVAALLVGIKTWYKAEPYSWVTLSVILLSVVGLFELIIVVTSPTIVWLDWFDYMKTLALVSIGLLLAVIFMERAVRKVL